MKAKQSAGAPTAVDVAWGMRGRICDLPSYYLDMLARFQSTVRNGSPLKPKKEDWQC